MYSMFSIFKTPKGFYAVAEGNMTRDVTLGQTSAGKNIVHASMGCGDNNVAERCRKAGIEIPEDVDVKSFMNLTVFGRTAEQFAEALHKGERVVVAGPIEYRENEGKDGRVFKSVGMIVNSFAKVGWNGDAPVVNPDVGRFTNVYEKDGEVTQRPYLANLVGKVKSKSALQKSDNGTTYIRVALESQINEDLAYALASGTYDRDVQYPEDGSTFDCTAFGKTAEIIDSYVAEESYLSVTGPVNKDKDGKIGVTIFGHTTVGRLPREDDDKKENQPARKSKSGGKAAPKPPKEDDFTSEDDEDGEIPF